MKPRLVICGETCSRMTRVSAGQNCWTRRVVVRLILIQLLFFTSEGCTKSQSYDGSTSRVPHITTTAALPNTSSSESESHKLPCSPKEVWLTGCLNGGSCFVIELHNSSTDSLCSCTSDWIGARCEFRYIDPKDWPVYEAQKRLKEICIAVGVGTVVLVAIILISVALYKRKQSREATSSTTTSGNSTTGNNNENTTHDASLFTDKQKNLEV